MFWLFRNFAHLLIHMALNSRTYSNSNDWSREFSIVIKIFDLIELILDTWDIWTWNIIQFTWKIHTKFNSPNVQGIEYTCHSEFRNNHSDLTWIHVQRHPFYNVFIRSQFPRINQNMFMFRFDSLLVSWYFGSALFTCRWGLLCKLFDTKPNNEHPQIFDMWILKLTECIDCCCISLSHALSK